MGNSTEQILQELDGILAAINKTSDAHFTQYEALRKQISGLKSSIRQKKQEVTSNSEKMSRYYQSQAQHAQAPYRSKLNELSGIRNRLNYLVPLTAVSVKPLAPQELSKAEAEELLEKIAKGGLWKKKNAAALWSRILAAERCCSNAIEELEQNLQAKKKAEADTSSKKLNSITQEGQRQLDLLEKQENALLAKLRAESESLAENDSRFRDIPRQIRQARTRFETVPGNGETYMPGKALPSGLLLGHIDYPCAIHNNTEVSRFALRQMDGYDPASNTISVPLIHDLNQPLLIAVDCEGSNVEFAGELFQSILSRMIGTYPTKSLQGLFFDPVNRGTALGSLLWLVEGVDADAFSLQCSSNDISRSMEELTEHVDQLCRQMALTGCRDIQEYNRHNSSDPLPHTAVVIHDYPNGFSEGSLETLKLLISKADQCGLSIFLSHKESDVLERSTLELWEDLPEPFWKIRQGEQPEIPFRGNRYRFHIHPTKLSKTCYQEICDLYNRQAVVDNRFSSCLGKALPPARSSLNGLDIPFAVDAGGNVLELQIGYTLNVHGFISGVNGSGKSSLLHTILNSAMLHYAPQELELWLVDYKETEFAYYMNNCPPHIRYIVADSSEEISYSILDEITVEMKRRRKLFRSAGVSDYVGYRKSKTGPCDLPRILVVIDEFHRMSQAISEETDYRIVLENIAAEARHNGITLLFADQSFSKGLSGVTPKTKDQLSVRIAMRNASDEIRETLNLESLQQRDEIRDSITALTSGVVGSMLYKRESRAQGSAISNQLQFVHCRCLHASREDMDRVRDLTQTAYSSFHREHSFFSGAVRQPFDAKRIAEYEKTHPNKDPRAERFYIGTPMGIQSCFPLSLKPGRSGENILLAGNDEGRFTSILAMIYRYASIYQYEIKTLISKNCPLYMNHRGFRAPVGETVSSFPEICRYIGEKANLLKKIREDENAFDEVLASRKKEFLVIIGLEELYADMEASRNRQEDAWPDRAPRPTRTIRHRIQAPIIPGLEEDEEPMAPAPVREEAPALKGYNATEDLGLLLAEGFKLGINAMAITENATALGRMRELPLDTCFLHRIALTMSPDNALDILSKVRVMRDLSDREDTISAVYQYSGGREQCFRPYLIGHRNS